MEFLFTDDFYSSYESLSDNDAVLIDKAIRRLLIDHPTAWARRGRVEGDRGGAWILSIASGDLDAALYWDYYNEESVVLLALAIRR